MAPYNVYEQENFKTFKFSNFDEICANFGIDGLIKKQCFITPKEHKLGLRLLDLERNQLAYINQDHVEPIHDDIIARHGIFFGKCDKLQYEAAPNCNELVQKFCHRLMAEELGWLINFFNCIHHYLSKRISAGKYLINHDVIRINLAEVIEDINLVKVLLDNPATDESLHTASKIITRALKNLGDCAGGRSFAGGNILEAFWLMTLLNQFVIGEDHNVH